MRIKAIDKIRMLDDDGTDLHMEPDDVKNNVGDNAGRLICEMGWGEDLDGVVPTGEKSTRPVTISPQNLVTQPTAKAKGAKPA